MIKVLIGKKGAGKTKTMIDNVNNSVSVASGDIVFISNDTKRHMYDINHKVRMIDTSEFEINEYSEFYGFLCGIVSNNYDISNIFIDSIYKIVGNDTEGMKVFFENADKLAKKFDITMFFTISIDPSEAPEYLKELA